MPYPLDFLPGHEAAFLLEVIQKLITIDSKDDYIDLIKSLNHIIPFDYATSGLVTLDSDGCVIGYDLLNINFSEDWITSYAEQKIYSIDVTVAENFKYYKTQCWRETYKKHDNPKRLLSFAHDFNLLNGYSCGAKGFGLYKKPSMISFVWNFEKNSAHISGLIEYLTPFIHIALSNVLYAQVAEAANNLLTRREKEVVSWLKEGKSSWEMSEILNVSEATINYHVNNIMKKLDAVNRTQIVAIALRNGIVELD
ncbi:helix-turn-helix transcriptional regulator [Fundidesulfovibrio agrisoli]|uniref:helix-turn-helix transcriptional regulator n=1 Tax=Fundidesulfovibrio agrisoli TaxID=2922717 RepID=UPI001FAC2015|nr:LuxR C-terminal-related transcriptional regulator [Fundidesulfovibrio agrisoli]